MPQDFAGAPDTYRLHDETRELYEHLIAEQAVLTVTEIDDWDAPWIDYTWVPKMPMHFGLLKSGTPKNLIKLR